MRQLLLLMLAAISVSPSYAQNANEDLLAWSPTRKLTWNDYKADPDALSDAAASTTTYLGIEYNIRRSGFSYKIHSKFSKDRSWGLHKTGYILSHEQGHFDIAEIHARILQKRMSEYVFNTRSAQKDLKQIYKEVTDAKEKMQNDYDRETRHSINKARQAEWLEVIAAMLDEYAAYADY